MDNWTREDVVARSAPSRPQELVAVLEPVVARAGLVLEDVTVTPAGRRRVVRVSVDLPDDEVGSLPHERVAEVSREVSSALDEADALGDQPYLLEVGSPGVDRPLVERRHWRRARTRLVRVDVTDEDGRVTPLTARVVAVDDGVVLGEGDERRHVPWERLGRGAVQVEFRRATGPDDEDGDDEDGDDEAGDDEDDVDHLDEDDEDEDDEEGRT
ncbi:ribosome maturation factor RimP [Pseudokineococcus sp. 1T1Z-3]|uniref:ribosome maturation factor RimP n=1 Tax=Pseudokineococcus sp. 1T1Z-3 TaxID=3132745 RepID=UPI00309CFA5E